MRRPHEAAFDVLQTNLADDDNMLMIPVDPFELAEKFGIIVTIGSLEPGTSGVIAMQEGDAVPRIVLNGAESATRQRFTLAHELGHYI